MLASEVRPDVDEGEKRSKLASMREPLVLHTKS
jgi:hypothetical protein